MPRIYLRSESSSVTQITQAAGTGDPRGSLDTVVRVQNLVAHPFGIVVAWYVIWVSISAAVGSGSTGFWFRSPSVQSIYLGLSDRSLRSLEDSGAFFRLSVTLA